MADQDDTQQPQASANQTPPPPIVIDGGTVPTGSPAPTLSQTTDGKTIVNQELFRQGDVVISNERIPQGNQFADVVVIQTGAGDDNVQVSQRANGVLDVQINGQAYEITLDAGQQLAVRGGDGNDIIQAADNVQVNMDVRGGEGNDTITTGQGRDRVDGGRGDDNIQTRGGRDDVFGGEGKDTIDAGDGNDVVYGGDGDDTVLGGRGNDYLEGGRGNDTIDGGHDKDVISGGQGDDTLRGSQGRDTVYTGAGADKVDNQSGRDKVYGQSSEDSFSAARGARNDVVDVNMSAQVGSSIIVQGSDEFRQRVEADLDMLRSSPNGRQLLAAFDRAADPTTGTGNRLTITEFQNATNGFAGGHPLPGTNELTLSPKMFLQTDAAGVTTPGTGAPAMVQYNPSFHSEQFPVPSAFLYHELSHAYNIVNGTLQQGIYTGGGRDAGKDVPNAERQAVGLPSTGQVADIDRNPATQTSRDNPRWATENGIREEMGLPKRKAYDVDLPAAIIAPGAPGAPGASAAPTSAAPAPATPAPATPTPPEPAPAPASPAPPRASGAPADIPMDPYLGAMLNAMDTGNRGAMRDAQQGLRNETAFGRDFKQEGIAAIDADRSQREQPPVLAAQIEAPTQAAPMHRR